jgi:glutamate synthase (NADPH/NADH) large chain
MIGPPQRQGLYDPRNEKDACGVGFIAKINGDKSNEIVRDGLQILANLDHRGAVGADPLIGDGAGCLIQVPDALFRDWADGRGITLPREGQYAVAMCFLPQETESREAAVARLERYIDIEGQILLGWRDVPVDTTGMSRTVVTAMPVIRQAIVAQGPRVRDQDAFERKLLSIRKQTQNPIGELAGRLPGLAQFHVPSFSSRTIVYKGLLLATQVGTFYQDLTNPLTKSALALVHQRFSTNTFPSWKLAHPFRFIAHNGEINTVRGNVNWMNARRRTLESPLLGADLDKMWPLIPHGQSDTASLDNALELLVAAATRCRTPSCCSFPRHGPAMRRWMPGAAPFTNIMRLDGAVGRPGRDRLYRWAADRRHARPQRASSGAFHDYRRRPDHHGIGKRRASDPGGADPSQVAAAAWAHAAGRLEQGRIVEDEEIKSQLADAHPYGDWLRETQFKLEDLPPSPEPPQPVRDGEALTAAQKAFGYSEEDLKLFLARWRASATIRSDRWATTRRWRCCHSGPSSSTIISSRTSRR